MTETKGKIHPLLAMDAQWRGEVPEVKIMSVLAKAFVPSNAMISDHGDLSDSGNSRADIYISTARLIGAIGQLSGWIVPFALMFGPPEVSTNAALTFLGSKALSLGSEAAEKYIAQKNGFVANAEPGPALIGP